MTTLVLVPTPLRQSRARRRLCDAQDGVLLGPRVATLRNLVPGLLAAAGERRALLSPLAERIVALDAARAAGLAPPDGGGGRARAATGFLAEARRAEVSSDDLRGAAASAAGRPAERLLAAAAGLAAYEARLRELRALDAAGAMRAAADAAAHGAASEETRDLGLLVLEGLLPVDRAAVDLGVALASRAGRVIARLPFLPGEPLRSAPAAPWVRRIEALHELAAVRDIRIEFPASGAVAPRRALRLPCLDDEAQAAAAARLAASLLEEGMAPEDVAVLAPAPLLELLPPAFEGLGVPLAAPVTRPLSSIPVVRDVRAALGAAGGLDRAAVEALLSSPVLRSGPPPRLGHLLDRAGAVEGRGDPEERLRARAAALSGAGAAGAERRQLLGLADDVAALRRTLAPFRPPATPSAWASRVRAFLERSGARRRLADGEPALVRRDLAALARLEDLLDDLAAALQVSGRSGALPREELLPLLDAALAMAEMPAGGGPAASAVEAWPAEEAPGIVARAVVVLGASRGDWPPPPRGDSILGSEARDALRTHLGRRAVSTAGERQAEAELRGWWALAGATDVLAVAWSAGADRVPPAPLAAVALELAGAIEGDLGRDPALAAARGAGEALRAAARLAAGGLGARAVESLAGAPDLAARVGSAADRGRMEAERREAWVAGTGAPSAGLLPEDVAAAWAAALPGEWSPTDLETFAGCPYRFFLRAAGVQEREGAGLDIEPRDEGALLHAALEAFVRSRMERGAWPPSGGAEDVAEARALAEPVLDRFEAEGRVGDPATWAGRREALFHRLGRFIEGEAARGDGLRPVLVEHEFGGRSGRPPVVVPAPDGEIRLKGRIDRVDADGSRILVVDYKNARTAQPLRERLSPDALGAWSFQLPAYALAAARELPGRAEIGATYALLRAGERLEPWRVPAGDPFLALDPGTRAAARAEGGRTFADGVAEVVARVRAGVLPVAPRECTSCPFGAVCRFPRAGEA